jgi:hypothetical protein
MRRSSRSTIANNMIQGVFMKLFKIAAACVAAVVLSACATSMTPYNPKAALVKAENNSVSAIQVNIAAKAKSAVGENPLFSQKDLHEKVKHFLTNKQLLADKAGQGKLSVDIEVTDVRIRSTISAVMFGFLAGADSLDGDVIIKDAAGVELNRYAISAVYAWGGTAGSNDLRLSYLYESFAEKVADALSGKTSS